METKELIKRADGIEYYRKKREIKYDVRVNFKWSSSQLNKMKQIAEKKGMKYHTLIKEILDKYIEEELCEK